MRKTIITTIVLTLSVYFLPVILHSPGQLLRAQPGGDDGDLDGDPGGVPIDGGISLLVGAAVMYGAKKIRDKKKAEREETEK